MPVRDFEVHPGMDVYAMDGEKIGSVVKVWRSEPLSEQIDHLREHAPDVDISHEMTANTGNTAYDATGGDLGTVPSGALTEKARGGPTTTEMAAGRDVSTYSGKRQGVEPGEGGMDSLRGYGVQHGGPAGLGAHGSAESATGYMNPAGSGGNISDFGRVPDVGEAAGAGAAGGSMDTTLVEPEAPGKPREYPGYFLVQDPGFLGVGGRVMYVPFRAVTRIQPGESLRIDCVSDEAYRRYGGPPGLEIDENADVLPF